MDFSSTDPRGRLIKCTDESWHRHVLPGHPGMRGMEDAVIATISNPELGFIYQDKDYPNRHIYYRRQTQGREFLKVVVQFDDEDAMEGWVVTAYLCDSKKPGELWIWPESND